MKKVLLFFAAMICSISLKAQCPLNEAVDFTATDCHGTEVHLFDILDGGQYVLIDFFFTTCGPCQQATPKIVESYYAFGCNQHDVFYMEISNSDADAACQTWANTYGVEYPTIGTTGGGGTICNTYGITAYPTVILIAPNHDILINDLWPINNAQSVITALEAQGIEQHECGTVADPQVEIAVGEVTTTTVEATFTPNEDCASYWYMIGTESEMQMWMVMMGATIEQLVMMWGINETEATTYTWTGQTPNTEYTIYVVPVDADGNAYPVVTENATTLSQGGAGEALVEISVELLSDGTVKTIAVPNENVAEYHYGLITVEYYNEIGEEEAVNIFREDNHPLYDEEEWVWPESEIEPDTYYYALGTAKNAEGEWGETTLVEFYTDFNGITENVMSCTIYPNPANDFITVTGEGINEIAVYNTIGQQIEKMYVENNEVRISTSEYEDGVYFIRINGEKTVRFVVTH